MTVVSQSCSMPNGCLTDKTDSDKEDKLAQLTPGYSFILLFFYSFNTLFSLSFSSLSLSLSLSLLLFLSFSFPPFHFCR